MKKIILFSLAALAVGITSCDMNKEPIGVINEENAIESTYDLFRFRNTAYNAFRSISGGSTWTLLDLQADEFYGTVNNGYRNMEINGGVLLPNNGSTGSVFAGSYGNIANLNYFLNKVNTVKPTSEEDSLTISRYIGEVEFIRAYHYYVLMDRFCNSPLNIDPNAPATGLQLVTVFNPSQDRASYPGRSTLAETIKFIQNDVDDAEARITAWFENPVGMDATEFSALQAPMAYYINPMTIKAFKARLAFIEGRYQDCVDLSNEIIKSGRYTLADGSKQEKQFGVNQVAALWQNDYSNEIIYMPFATKGEGGMNWGGLWIGSSPKDCDFMPTPYVAQNLYASNDTRLKVFIGSRTIDFSGTKVKVPAFTKFPGNVALRQQDNTNNLLNKNKVFRLSEVYLNMAEAYYHLGNMTEARNAMDKVRSARIPRYRGDATLTGEDLFAQIKLERQRELIGEGFRISDLRRWHDGFYRDNTGYTNGDVKRVIRRASLISYPKDSYKYVWPLPSEEFVNNPQVKGQQNPGY